MSGPPSPPPPPGMPPGAASPAVRVWRDGPRLVVRRGFPIPPFRCVFCPGRASGTARLQGARSKAMQVPLCAHHLSRHRSARIARWTAGLAGFSIVAVGLGLDVAPLALAGLIAGGGGLLYAAVASRLLTVDEAGQHFVRLRGADLRYLDTLHDWSGYPEPPE